MAQRLIKLFSHNDLDGFGAPLLLKTLQPVMFEDTEFDMTNCGAGRIDEELSRWMQTAEVGRFTDVYIMDMTPDSDYSFKLLNERLTIMKVKQNYDKSMRPIVSYLLIQQLTQVPQAWYGIG